ncbi:MAG TPA: serine/threonine-protein kinase [Blastocatellia bacterium]|nr:serine/threonine-protein kinase [Blastocatellia bacterium]
MGTGAYGAVYKGDTVRDGIVALKILHIPTGIVNPNLFGRAEKTLLREFAAGKKLRHPNLAEVHCFGSALWEGQRRLCVMSEFVDGEELRTAATALSNDDERLRVLLELSIGLQAIHEGGLVHRDLSSRNVMLTRDGQVKVLDFGVAFFVQATLSSLSLPFLLERDTDASAMKPRGNPPYMAPEVWRPDKYEGPGGTSFDPATGLYVPMIESDIFAFGIIAYEVLAGGRHPFGFFEMTVQEFKEAICKRRKNVPWPSHAFGSAAVRGLIDRCLSRRPQDRPSLEEVIASLTPHVSNQSQQRPTTGEDAIIDPAPFSPSPAAYYAWLGDDSDGCTFDENGRCNNAIHWGANE